jgi:signal peptidase I
MTMSTPARFRLVRALLGAALLLAGLAVLLPRYGTHTVGTAVMAPAVHGGETVVVRDGAPARRGDIVVVDAWDGVAFTVRVVGVGRDVVTSGGGDHGLRVNGAGVREPYAHGATDTFGDFAVTVPPGRLFVLGDARSVSVDSRSHLDENGGTLAAANVRGPVVAVVGPVWRTRPLARLTDVLPLAVTALTVAAGLVLLLVAVWPVLRRGAAAVSRAPAAAAPRSAR